MLEAARRLAHGERQGDLQEKAAGLRGGAKVETLQVAAAVGADEDAEEVAGLRAGETVPSAPPVESPLPRSVGAGVCLSGAAMTTGAEYPP